MAQVDVEVVDVTVGQGPGEVWVGVATAECDLSTIGGAHTLGVSSARGWPDNPKLKQPDQSPGFEPAPGDVLRIDVDSTARTLVVSQNGTPLREPCAIPDGVCFSVGGLRCSLRIVAEPMSAWRPAAHALTTGAGLAYTSTYAQAHLNNLNNLQSTHTRSTILYM